MFVLVNVAVQLDRDNSKASLFEHTKRKRRPNRGHNVPKSAEVVSVLQEADWLAVRELAM